MVRLKLVRGLPGSGKSTLARCLVASGEFDCHFEADMFFRLDPSKPAHPLAGIFHEFPLEFGEYKFDPERVTLAHSWCQLKTAAALAMGRSAVVSNTFVQKWEVRPYLDIAARFPTPVPVEISVATGRYRNVHGVPEQVIGAMAEKWEE